MLSLKVIEKNNYKKEWLHKIRESEDWDPFSDLGFLDIITNNYNLIEFSLDKKVIGRITLAKKMILELLMF